MDGVQFEGTSLSRSWQGAARPVACGDPARATLVDPILQNCRKELYACRAALACVVAKGRRRLMPLDKDFVQQALAGSPEACWGLQRWPREAEGRDPRLATGGTRGRMQEEVLPSLASQFAGVRVSQHCGPRGGRAQSSAHTRRRAGLPRHRGAAAGAGSAWRSPGSSRRARVPPWGRAGRTPAGSGLPPRHRAAQNSALRPNDDSRRAHTHTAFIFTDISSLILE